MHVLIQNYVEKYEVILRWFFDRSAPITFFVLFLFGAIMLVISVVAGVGEYELILPSGIKKQVGYLWALNWSFMFLLGFPIMLFFMLETADSLRRTLDRLVENRMIVDPAWQPAELQVLDAERARFWHNSATAGLILLVALTAYCLSEWYAVSGRYLIANELPIEPGQKHFFDELDWSVAAVLKGPEHSEVVFRIVNAVFSFVNYLLLGVYLSVVFTYYAMLIMYADMFRRLSQANVSGKCRIIPDVNDSDPRRGFGLFKRVFQRVLFATLLGFFMAYFMNLQNAFLRSESPDIMSFVSGDLANGFSLFANGKIIDGLADLAGTIFSAPHMLNLTSAWAVLMVFGFFSLVALALAWTLSQTAERSRDDLRVFIRDEANTITQLTELNRDTAIERLSEWDSENETGMVIWPFGWPRLQELLVFLAFGAICTILYRLGLIFAGIAIAWITVSIVIRFGRN